MIACLPILLAACSTIGAQRTSLLNGIRREVSDVPAFATNASFSRTLDALGAVPREAFVPHKLRPQAYGERPQDIGYGQTISDPYIVTIMTAAAELRPEDRVLEVGTGSGYQAAVLSRLARAVYSIEIVAPLAKLAASRLKRLGYRNVQVRAGDGFGGWPDAAPFDAILVTAGAAEPPAALLAQLAPGGRMIMPVGPSTVQERLIVFRKAADGAISRCALGGAMFVPLTGQGARAHRAGGVQERGLVYCYGGDLGRWDVEVVPAKP